MKLYSDLISDVVLLDYERLLAYMSLVHQCITVLALDLEGVHDVKLHHPSSSVATSNQ